MDTRHITILIFHEITRQSEILRKKTKNISVRKESWDLFHLWQISEAILLLHTQKYKKSEIIFIPFLSLLTLPFLKQKNSKNQVNSFCGKSVFDTKQRKWQAKISIKNPNYAFSATVLFLKEKHFVRYILQNLNFSLIIFVSPCSIQNFFSNFNFNIFFRI